MEASSEAELRSDVDRLVVLLGRFGERGHPVMVLRVAHAGGDIEVAGQPIAALEIDGLIGRDARRRGRGLGRGRRIDPRGEAARLFLRARARLEVREVGDAGVGQRARHHRRSRLGEALVAARDAEVVARRGDPHAGFAGDLVHRRGDRRAHRDRLRRILVDPHRDRDRAARMVRDARRSEAHQPGMAVAPPGDERRKPRIDRGRREHGERAVGAGGGAIVERTERETGGRQRREHDRSGSDHRCQAAPPAPCHRPSHANAPYDL